MEYVILLYYYTIKIKEINNGFFKRVVKVCVFFNHRFRDSNISTLLVIKMNIFLTQFS